MNIKRQIRKIALLALLGVALAMNFTGESLTDVILVIILAVLFDIDLMLKEGK